MKWPCAGGGLLSPPVLRWAARLAYGAVLAVATLSSLEWDVAPGTVAERLGTMLRPTLTARDAVDAARNLTLFAGWGLVWTLTSPPGRSGKEVRDAVLTGAAASLAVELVQLLSTSRTASVLDLLTNTAGALAGALLLGLATRSVAARVGRRSYFALPALVPAAAYAAAVLGEALVPLFRQTPLAGVYGGPLRRFSAAVEAFRWESLGQLPLGDVMLFLPAGLLAVLALVEEGMSRAGAVAWTALAGAAAMVAVEGVRGVLALPIHAGAALVHGLAVGAGALVAFSVLPGLRREGRGADRSVLLLLAWVGILLLWNLRPYVPETDPAALLAKLRTDWWVPLRFLGMRVDVFSVVDVVTRFFLYVPVGALLAARPLRSRGPLASVFPALYLAALTELAQLFVAGRTLDGTDFLVQGAGALVGWALIRRAGGARRARSGGGRHLRMPARVSGSSRCQ